MLVRRDFGMGEYIQTVTVEGVFCHQTSSTMDDFKEREREQVCACVVCARESSRDVKRSTESKNTPRTGGRRCCCRRISRGRSAAEEKTTSGPRVHQKPGQPAQPLPSHLPGSLQAHPSLATRRSCCSVQGRPLTLALLLRQMRCGCSFKLI